MYRLILNPFGPKSNSVLLIEKELSIPFDSQNTDYQTFKNAINNETAQLETVDGVLMTQEEAKAYVATLP